MNRRLTRTVAATLLFLVLGSTFATIPASADPTTPAPADAAAAAAPAATDGTQAGQTGQAASPQVGLVSPSGPVAITGTDPAAGTQTQTGTGTDASASLPDDLTNTATGGVMSIVSQFAIASLKWTLNAIENTTTPVLNGGGDNAGNWFVKHYALMKAIAVWVMVPLLFISVIHAIAKGSLAMILRSFLVFLPTALVGMVIAVEVVQLLLNVTDDFAETFIGSVKASSTVLFADVTNGFGAPEINLLGISFFVTLFLGLALGAVCIGVFIILVLREASVYIATSMLPIGFAMLVWPSTGKYLKRMVEFLAGLIFSKLVMVAGISLTVAALASQMTGNAAAATLAANGGNQLAVATVGTDAKNNAAATTSVGIWVTQTITTIVMFAVVGLAPNAVSKLVGNLGMGEMARHFAAHNSRPEMTKKVILTHRSLGTASILWGTGTADRPAGFFEARRHARLLNRHYRDMSPVEASLAAAGVELNPISDAELDHARIFDPSIRQNLLDMTSAANNDPNDHAAARAALDLGEEFEGFRRVNSDPTTGTPGYTIADRRYSNGEREVLPIFDVAQRNANGQWVQSTELRDRVAERKVARVVSDLIAQGETNIRPVVFTESGNLDGEGRRVAGLNTMLRQMADNNPGVRVRIPTDNPVTARAFDRATVNPAGRNMPGYHEV